MNVAGTASGVEGAAVLNQAGEVDPRVWGAPSSHPGAPLYRLELVPRGGEHDGRGVGGSSVAEFRGSREALRGFLERALWLVLSLPEVRR